MLADAKRGDIGSTMAAYAAAWAGDSPLAVDAVTASPYLGFGSLQPLLDAAAANGRGVFVLAATSNPEGAGVQCAQTDGRTVAQSIVDAAAAVNRAASPEPGSVGVVVGATLSTPPDVSALGGPVLVPGVGAQGGRPDALLGFGGARPGQLLPAVSRELLRAGPDVAACVRPRSGCATPSPTWPDQTASAPFAVELAGREIGLLRNVVDNCSTTTGHRRETPRHARNSVTRQNFLFLKVHKGSGCLFGRADLAPERRWLPENPRICRQFSALNASGGTPARLIGRRTTAPIMLGF